MATTPHVALNSTAELRFLFLDEDGDPIETGTVTYSLADPSGSVVSSGSMSFDATQRLRTGFTPLGCWVATVLNTALDTEGEHVCTYTGTDTNGQILVAVQTIIVETYRP